MKEMARLVKMNKPNLVVFIGEALVGNDAVDQITKFNKALQEESTDTFKP
jgi:signal recognition particle receptor subunit alpha